MMFRHFLTSANEGNVFVLACEETKEALLVDIGAFEPEIAAFIEEQGLHVTTIFITHDHYDHTGGLAEAVAHFGAEVVAGSSRPGGCKARRVAQGDGVKVGRLTGRVSCTPGHTADSVSLAFPGMVFTGDALFAGSVGGTSSSDAARQQIDHIREYIFVLPPETEVHTGHGPSSTVAVESRCNPFFV